MRLGRAPASTGVSSPGASAGLSSGVNSNSNAPPTGKRLEVLAKILAGTESLHEDRDLLTKVLLTHSRCHYYSHYYLFFLYLCLSFGH